MILTYYCKCSIEFLPVAIQTVHCFATSEVYVCIYIYIYIYLLQATMVIDDAYINMMVELNKLELTHSYSIEVNELP